MSDKSKAKPAPKTKRTDRVQLVNTKRQNGPIGATASPLRKDVDAWLAKGWKHKNPAENAE